MKKKIINGPSKEFEPLTELLERDSDFVAAKIFHHNICDLTLYFEYSSPFPDHIRYITITAFGKEENIKRLENKLQL